MESQGVTLGILLVLIFIGKFSANIPKCSKRPNIVLIVADDAVRSYLYENQNFWL